MSANGRHRGGMTASHRRRAAIWGRAKRRQVAGDANTLRSTVGEMIVLFPSFRPLNNRLSEILKAGRPLAPERGTKGSREGQTERRMMFILMRS